MVQIFGTSKCRSTSAARRYFSDRGIDVHFVDLKRKGLSAGELASVARAVGGLLKLYDASKDPVTRYATPSETQLTKMLVDEPSLLVTPIVRRAPKAAVGAAEEAWAEIVAAEKAG